MRIARLICMLLLPVGILAVPVPSQAQVAVGISVRIGPPVLPVYVQPVCPGPGFIWIPGYWAYGDDGYFWVPGTWVEPPEVGLLWTPGYWGWGDGFYIWHAGYWGPVVGFYGGIDYGFGYPGVGFYGGYWRGGNYFYNRSVTNVNVTVVHNVYERNVVNERHVSRVSFNGGPGGINARPTHEELAAEHERHVPMTGEQNRHFEAARGDRSLRASVNHGRPDFAASPRAGEFHGRAAQDNGRAGNPNRPDNRVESNRPERQPANNGRTFEDRPPNARSSSSKLDQKHQREADRLQRQQDSERQKMQQRQVHEQQKLQQRSVTQDRRDQLQRRQRQQSEQMQRKHDQQSQKLQQRQQREVQKQQNKPSKGGHPQGR